MTLFDAGLRYLMAHRRRRSRPDARRLSLRLNTRVSSCSDEHVRRSTPPMLWTVQLGRYAKEEMMIVEKAKPPVHRGAWSASSLRRLVHGESHPPPCAPRGRNDHVIDFLQPSVGGHLFPALFLA